MVYTTVVCVENAKEWAYKSCKTCRKKLKKEGQTYVCQSCGIANAKSILTYTIITYIEKQKHKLMRKLPWKLRQNGIKVLK